MERSLSRPTLAVAFLACALAAASAAEDAKFSKAKFTGWQSCGSTSCHGGGVNHDESLIFRRKDAHVDSGGLLLHGRSRAIVEALGLTGDGTKKAQCTVCHAPMQAVAPERLEKNVQADPFVACEACHGAAEPWLRFHTRPDVGYEQMVAQGMRDLLDVYGRANTCVACHQTIDSELVDATHPELRFDLDGQVERTKPHWKDARPGIGPRSWLTGQAVALREMSWKLAEKSEERLKPRWRALVWLLRKTEAGKQELPQSEDFGAMKAAADRLAKAAATGTWSKASIEKLLAAYAALGPEFRDAKLPKIEHQRRAEVLATAIARLWLGLQKPGEGGVAPTMDSAPDSIVKLKTASEGREDFNPETFATDLENLTKELALKP